MKNVFISLITVMMGASLNALPLGNPWEASLHCDGLFWEDICCDQGAQWCDAWSLRLGYYGDFVFDRHMQIDRIEDDSTIHETDITTNAAYITVNFWDRLDFFGTLGATRIEFETSASSITPLPTVAIPVRVDTETYFSWSIGLRGTIWECGYLGIGAEAHYFQTRPHLNSLAVNNSDTFYFTRNRLKYREWQIGLGASYRINIASGATALIPYAGIKWDRAHFNMDDAPIPSLGLILFDFESNRHFGYAIGLTLLGCNKSSITVEGRFLSEKALYVNGQVRF